MFCCTHLPVCGQARQPCTLQPQPQPPVWVRGSPLSHTHGALCAVCLVSARVCPTAPTLSTPLQQQQHGGPTARGKANRHRLATSAAARQPTPGPMCALARDVCCTAVQKYTGELTSVTHHAAVVAVLALQGWSLALVAVSMLIGIPKRGGQLPAWGPLGGIVVVVAFVHRVLVLSLYIQRGHVGPAPCGWRPSRLCACGTGTCTYGCLRGMGAVCIIRGVCAWGP